MGCGCCAAWRRVFVRVCPLLTVHLDACLNRYVQRSTTSYVSTVASTLSRLNGMCVLLK